jgi:hypothetical protein
VLQKDGTIEPSQIESDPVKLRLLNSLRDHANANHIVQRYANRFDLSNVVATYLPQALRAKYPKIDDRLADGATHALYFEQAKRPQLISHDDAPMIESLELLGWTGLGVLRDRGLVENCLRVGARIRILNVARGGLAAQLLRDVARKTDIDDDLDTAVRRVGRFADFAKVHGGSIELREIDWLPSSSLFCVQHRQYGLSVWLTAYTTDPTFPASKRWTTELRGPLLLDAANAQLVQFNSLWGRANIAASATP